jgi:hypothetical protein
MQAGLVRKYFGSSGELYESSTPQFEQSKMTAIVVVTAPWGVLMAADGRMNIDTDTENESTQKLFPVIDKARALVYGLAGSVATGSSLDNLSFDLRKEFKEQTELMSVYNFPSPNEYVASLVQPITSAINAVKHFPESNGTASNGGSKIATAIFGGCFGPLIFTALVEFSHSGGEATGRITSYREGTGQRICYGSGEIMKIMYDKYFNPLPNSPLFKYSKRLGINPLVSEAKQFATGYIEACCSQEGRSLDSNGCRYIGGHIHVASIKPRSGFQWITPPLP